MSRALVLGLYEGGFGLQCMTFSVDEKSTANSRASVDDVGEGLGGKFLKGRLGGMCGRGFGITRRACGLHKALSCPACTSL